MCRSHYGTPVPSTHSLDLPRKSRVEELNLSHRLEFGLQVFDLRPNVKLRHISDKCRLEVCNFSLLPGSPLAISGSVGIFLTPV